MHEVRGEGNRYTHSTLGTVEDVGRWVSVRHTLLSHQERVGDLGCLTLAGHVHALPERQTIRCSNSQDNQAVVVWNRDGGRHG